MKPFNLIEIEIVACKVNAITHLLQRLAYMEIYHLTSPIQGEARMNHDSLLHRW